MDAAPLWAAHVDAICGLGNAYYRQGQIDLAERVLQAGITTFAMLPDVAPPVGKARLLAATVELLANGLFLYGQELDPAQPMADEAMALAEQSGDDLLEARVLDVGGLLHYYQAMHGSGDYSAARSLFAQALDLLRRGNDERALSKALFHNGLVAERQEDKASAIKFYDEAYALAKRAGAGLEQSYAARHRAWHNDNSVELFAESLRLRQELGYKVLLPLSYVALGEAYATHGAVAQAREQLQQALAIAEDLDLPVPLALSALSAGEFSAKQGDLDAAREYLGSAKNAADRAGVSWLRGLVAAESEGLRR